MRVRAFRGLHIFANKQPARSRQTAHATAKMRTVYLRRLRSIESRPPIPAPSPDDIHSESDGHTKCSENP